MAAIRNQLTQQAQIDFFLQCANAAQQEWATRHVDISDIIEGLTPDYVLELITMQFHQKHLMKLHPWWQVDVTIHNGVLIHDTPSPRVIPVSRVLAWHLAYFTVTKIVADARSMRFYDHDALAVTVCDGAINPGKRLSYSAAELLMKPYTGGTTFDWLAAGRQRASVITAVRTDLSVWQYGIAPAK